MGIFCLTPCQEDSCWDQRASKGNSNCNKVDSVVQDRGEDLLLDLLDSLLCVCYLCTVVLSLNPVMKRACSHLILEQIRRM